MTGDIHLISTPDEKLPTATIVALLQILDEQGKKVLFCAETSEIKEIADHFKKELKLRKNKPMTFKKDK